MSLDAYNAGISNSTYNPSTANWSQGLRNPFDPSKPYQFGDILGGIWRNISGTKAQEEYNAQQAAETRAYNERQAREQREWEERMANTTYQRAASDMKAAGLNPALLNGLTSGSASSTGSGSAASASAASSSPGNNGLVTSLIGALALFASKKLFAGSKTFNTYNIIKK